VIVVVVGSMGVVMNPGGEPSGESMGERMVGEGWLSRERVRPDLGLFASDGRVGCAAAGLGLAAAGFGAAGLAAGVVVGFGVAVVVAGAVASTGAGAGSDIVRVGTDSLRDLSSMKLSDLKFRNRKACQYQALLTSRSQTDRRPLGHPTI
jgi:hypothetical protein